MKTELIEQIEAFLDGEINRESLQLKAEILGVDDLDENIIWVKNARLAVEADGLRNQLKKTLPKSEEETGKIVTLPVNKWKWTVAAAAVIIVLLGYWGTNLEGEPTLYAKYKYVDPGLPVLMSQSDDHLLYDALTYYSEGNYEVAEEKLLQIQDQYINNDTLIYYLGASQLYQGKSVSARQTLEKISAKENSKYKQDAEWLIVLTLLREENIDATKSALKVIVASQDHKFLDDATNLLKELTSEDNVQ